MALKTAKKTVGLLGFQYHLPGIAKNQNQILTVKAKAKLGLGRVGYNGLGNGIVKNACKRSVCHFCGGKLQHGQRRLIHFITTAK